MVAGLKKPDVVVPTNMNAKVHVYGGLDMAKDVAAFYLSPMTFAAEQGVKGGIDLKDLLKGT